MAAKGAHAHKLHDESSIAGLVNKGIYEAYNPVLSQGQRVSKIRP